MALGPFQLRLRAWALLLLALALPPATYVGWAHLPCRGVLALREPGETPPPPSTLPCVQETIGPPPHFRPMLTNVQIVDLDRDGLPDLVACDGQTNRVLWYRQAPRGTWTERVLAEDLPVPVHANMADFDGDGDLDILVAVLGSYRASDEYLGRVVWLENAGGERFVSHELLDNIRRVADVQAGDLNGDGHMDLVVAVFGFKHGQVLWLENLGDNLHFQIHVLLSAPGTIHVPLADLDGDGDLDICAVVSQDDEEVWGFENLGGGRFKPHLLRSTSNFELGSTGLEKCDLNGDGKTDLLLTAGDSFEDPFTYPQPQHGCFWLENQGGWSFASHRIGQLGGAYAAAAGDLDGDGHQDVVLVSLYHGWMNPENASAVWLQNDGKQNFRAWCLAARPTHLVTVACGDLNGDGRADVVAGGLHAVWPYDRLGRITAWFSAPGHAP